MPCNKTLSFTKFGPNIEPVHCEQKFRRRLLQEAFSLLYLLFGNLFFVVSIVFNSLALVACFFCFKRFKNQTALLFDGYIAIFRTFAEFVSAAVCVIYGVIDAEMLHVVGGTFGIILGLMIRVLFYLNQKTNFSDNVKSFTMVFTGVYVFVVFLCSCAFYQIALDAGAVHCASRIATCVLPMMALSETIKHRINDSFLLSTIVDVITVSVLCLYCARISLKYFFFLPSFVGILLVAIEKISSDLINMLMERDSSIADVSNSVDNNAKLSN